MVAVAWWLWSFGGGGGHLMVMVLSSGDGGHVVCFLHSHDAMTYILLVFVCVYA